MGTNATKLIVTSCVVLSTVLVAIPLQGQVPPFFGYDGFNETFINPDRWVVKQAGGDAGREYVREVRSNRLRLVNRAYGSTNSSTGGPFDGTFLDFPDSIVDSITGFKATIRVTEFEATGCSTNAGGVRAELFGDFFNTDVPTPGSHFNDVRVSVSILRLSNSTDPNDVLRVFSSVHHCHDASCSSVTNLGFQDLGIANRGDKVTLVVLWDPGNDQFVFQRDNQPAVFLPYTVSDTAPPGSKRKGLLVASFPPNCIGPTRPFSFMEAFFDDVFTR